MISRDVIWKLVQSMIDEKNHQQMCSFEGNKKYEDDVKDIVDKVEELAITIENKINADKKSSFDTILKDRMSGMVYKSGKKL